MKKTDVLFVVHQLNIGGVQKALLSTLDALDYDRYDVSLYVQKDRTDLLKGVNPNVKEIRVNRDRTRYYRRTRAVLYAILIRLLRLFGRNADRIENALRTYVKEQKLLTEKKRFPFRGRRFDVAVAFKQAGTARFVAEAVDADRKIMVFHGSLDEEHDLHTRILPAFERIVAVNEACRDLLRSLYPSAADRIGYIENHTDARRIRALAAAYAAPPAGDRPTLCSCGRFSEEKGFDLAADAAALLRERGEDFLWYFIGDGPERAAIERKIEARGLTEHVRLTGLLENPYPYIAQSDVYVQPSRAESFGLSILEAQILLRPVVSTATVGGTHLIRDGETGLLAAADAADLADKIENLLHDPARRAALTERLRGIDRADGQKTYAEKWNDLLSSKRSERQ